MNNVILIGNLGKEPEVVNINGTKIATFTLATSRRDKNKTTDWHTVTVFDKTAEIVEQYVHKGDKVAVEGSVQYTRNEKDGRVTYFTKIVGSRIEMLSKAQHAEIPDTQVSETEDLPH